jgi:Uncharacterized protein, 4-oxalocrotonate tautomerase homolog
MPLITVKLLEGAFSQTQKGEMIRKITDAIASIEGENESVAWILIEEIKSGNWGVAGDALTITDVKERTATETLTTISAHSPPAQTLHQE